MNGLMVMNHLGSTELSLSRERFALRQLIDRTLLETLGRSELTTYYDSILDRMVVDLNTSILAEKLEPKIIEDFRTKVIYIPLTWWQFFKDQYSHRWWLGWFVKRYPVKTRKVKWDVAFKVRVEPMILFPHAETPSPNDSVRYVNILKSTNED